MYKRMMMDAITLKTTGVLWLIFLASCAGSTALAQPAEQERRIQQLFNEANYHYEQQEFAQALARYKDIEEAGFMAPELFLNTGLTYLRLQEGGHALYYFMRAERIRPGWSEAEEAISFTQNWLQEAGGPVPVLNTFQLYSTMQQRAGDGRAFLWSVLLLNAAGASMLLYWFLPFYRLRRASWYGSFILAGGSFITLAMGIYLQQTARSWQPGIVVESGYSIYESRKRSEETLLSLSPGSHFFMSRPETRRAADPALPADESSERLPEWVYVYHSSGIEGWVRTEAVRLL